MRKILFILGAVFAVAALILIGFSIAYGKGNVFYLQLALICSALSNIIICIYSRMKKRNFEGKQ